MRTLINLLCTCLLFALVIPAQSLAQPPFGSQAQTISGSLSEQPLAFTENRGQWDDKALFRANAGGATFFFCPDEVAYLFIRSTGQLAEEPWPDVGEIKGQPERPRYQKEALALHARFVGANPNPEIIGQERLPYNHNYFYGNDPAKWRPNVPNYGAIIYRDLWPGIDLKYYGDGKGMKYDFIVNPEADISQIRVKYEGAEGLSISNLGDLEVQTRFGLMNEKAPYLYQEIDGVRHPVAGRYALAGEGTFGFIAGREHDPTEPLIIDPEILFSSYLGGNDEDVAYQIISDWSGAYFIAGSTESSNFPIYYYYDASFNGTRDVFISKFYSGGDYLRSSTYLGGSGDDQALGLTIDEDWISRPCLSGITTSTDFPTINPFDGSYNGNGDAFITKFNSSMDALEFSSYFGGNLVDEAYSVAIDGSHCVYICGWTESANIPTVNYYDNSYGGNGDGFVAKFTYDASSLIYSTYLGGGNVDAAFAIAVDDSGCAYVTGQTQSDNFPTCNPYDGSLGGLADAFVTKFSPIGNSLIYSTYLGGSQVDFSQYGIAIDNLGCAHVIGMTESMDFPVANPYDGTLNGDFDVFLSKFSASGASLLFSTFLGGSGGDRGCDVAIDYNDNIYICGWTASADFPTVSAYDSTHNGGNYDAFVARLLASSGSLIYSTYLGGSNLDYGRSISTQGLHEVYIAGNTVSTDFPTEDPYDSSHNGLSDVFMAGFNLFVDTLSVISSVPALNELNVLANSNISATFDSNIDAPTINDSTFIVNGRSSGRHAGVINYNGSSRIATFNPATDFQPGEQVSVVLTSGITSEEGIPLINGYCWSFSAAADNGTGEFEAQVNYPAGDYPTSVYVSDIDGDGDNDLAVANLYSDNISTLRNNGDGTFQVAVNYVVGDGSRTVFSSDLDSDGDMDLASANGNADNISILKNNGEGTYQAAVNFEAGDDPRFVIGQDLDGDGYIDLVVTNWASSCVSVLKNNGEATFLAPVSYGTGYAPRSICTADLDGDGDIDLGVANSSSTFISVLLNNGNGTFQTAASYGAGDGPFSIIASDLDDDGDNDLAAANWNSSNVSVLRNNGDGTFSAAVNFGAGGIPYSVSASDFDSDGDNDLAVANMSSDNVSILENNGDGTFQAAVNYAAGDGAYSVFAADLNGDGDIDLAVANQSSDNISILMNLPEGPELCPYLPGDINGNGSPNGIDVTYGVSYLKGGNAPPIDCNPPCTGVPDPFYAAGDVNGSCSFNGIDITYFVSYLKGGPGLQSCPNCPPALIAAPAFIPVIAPAKGVAKDQLQSD